MMTDIGWLFLGAFSRMGTYAAVTASASALGVIPGATHKAGLGRQTIYQTLQPSSQKVVGGTGWGVL
jgi:hypothetical protein